MTYTYTQTATGGNLQIDTGNTATGTPVVITDLKITGNGYIWEPNFSIIADPGQLGGGEYIGDNGNQYGIQAADKNNMTISLKSGALYVTATNGTYKPVNIQTGTAVGGTSWWANQGFVAAADVTYTVSFKASIVPPVTGEVRVRGNNTGDWQTTNLTATPVDGVCQDSCRMKF